MKPDSSSNEQTATMTETKPDDSGEKETKDNGEKAPTSARQKKATKRGRKRRRRVKFPSGGDSDDEKLKSRFLKRGGKEDQAKAAKYGKLEAERGPVIKRKDGKNGNEETFDVLNPSTYHKLFARLEETHFNKVVKPDGVCLENTPWICCFCQRGPCVDGLGDLFGPYYTKLSFPSFWPPFVNDAKGQKSGGATAAAASDVYMDFWFHGDCVFWAPGILLRGWGMTGLDEYLPKYWEQKCTRCHRGGASIVCTVKSCHHRLHYPCALASGSIFNDSNYSMYCESHKKLAEKKK